MGRYGRDGCWLFGLCCVASSFLLLLYPCPCVGILVLGADSLASFCFAVIPLAVCLRSLQLVEGLVGQGAGTHPLQLNSAQQRMLVSTFDQMGLSAKVGTRHSPMSGGVAALWLLCVFLCMCLWMCVCVCSLFPSGTN